MNRHSKIIVILLLIVLISLGTAIVMFHISVGKDVYSTEKSSFLPEVTDNLSSVDVFKDKNGLFGLKDSVGTIILEPEWAELEPFDTDFFKAKLITRSGSLYGVIDRNGNITVPFVYSEIKKLSENVYAASLNDTEEYLFYNKDFILIFPTSADNYYLMDKELCIVKGNDKFTYEQDDELSLIKAEIPRFKRPINLNIIAENEAVLSVVNSSQLSDIGDKAVLFLDMFRRNKTVGLSEIIDSASLADITAFVKTKHEWKGKLSDNTYVYTISPEDNDELRIYIEIELIIPNEEENAKNIQLTLVFRKDDEEQWIICETFIG